MARRLGGEAAVVSSIVVLSQDTGFDHLADECVRARVGHAQVTFDLPHGEDR